MKQLLFLALGLLLIGGSFVLFRESESPPSTAAAPVPATPSATTIELVVANKQRVSGPEVVRVAQDTTLILRITVDKDDEFHLHGYDRAVKLRAGQAETIELRADRTGRFEYELHHSHVALGVLEVTPRQ